MGYRIEYSEGLAIWKTERLRLGRVIIFGSILFIASCVVTLSYWPEGREILRSWLYPGNVEETRNALQHMASRLQAGESLSDAVFVFCQEILNVAKYPG